MRDKLQALLKQWKRASNACCENYEGKMLDACIKDFESILTTKPPAVSVKAGWVCKDFRGLTWFSVKPSHTGRYWCPINGGENRGWIDSVVTDPWETSHPNGGPECIMEIKP